MYYATVGAGRRIDSLRLGHCGVVWLGVYNYRCLIDVMLDHQDGMPLSTHGFPNLAYDKPPTCRCSLLIPICRWTIAPTTVWIYG